MNIQTWLKQAQAQLTAVSLATARLDCLVLLEDATEKDRAWLLSHPEYELQGSILDNLSTKIAQRAQYIPLAYIRGHVEFYGRSFTVNEHVLVPRPETEAMIETLKTLNLQPGTCIVDIGTGSGCIAISAALELPDTFVQACDIDMDCLKLAEQNADTLSANVHFYQSDLLTAVDACDVLLCNLPYVPDGYEINAPATHEPELALFAGQDGLDLFRKLFDQIQANDWQPRYVLTESLPEQHRALSQLASAANFELIQTNDFIQLFEYSSI